MPDTVTVTVTNPTRPGLDETLHPGDDMRFGRTIGGAGRISENSAVSGHHGTVHATPNGLSVTSTGRYYGFVVRDRATPSRLHVPCGIGPVPIPFARCSIVIEHLREPAYLDVTVTGSPAADAWDASWGPEIRHTWRAHVRGTAPPLHAKVLMKNGNPYRWFVTLVALCEPHLGVGPAGIPTNVELARRLHLDQNTIEAHLTRIYAELDVPDGLRRRDLAIDKALATGLVTPHDLHWLPPR